MILQAGYTQFVRGGCPLPRIVTQRLDELELKFMDEEARYHGYAESDGDGNGSDMGSGDNMESSSHSESASKSESARSSDMAFIADDDSSVEYERYWICSCCGEDNSSIYDFCGHCNQMRPFQVG